MELEKDTLNALIAYLESHGYPPDSFAIEYSLGKTNRYRVDLAILDLELKQPIALFEIKGHRSDENEARGRQQLQTYISTLEVKNIPTYLVFLKEGTPPFEIVRVSTDQDHDIKLEREGLTNELLNFNILEKSGLNQTIEVKKKEQKKQVDSFNAISLILAAFVLALLIADLTGAVIITATRLILLAIIIGLILIPWASKIKFAGIEFERLIKEKRA